MRPWGVFVHLGFSYCPVFIARVHYLLHFPDLPNDGHGQIFDKYLFFSIFFHFHSKLGIATKQVMDLFVVYFEVGASHEVFFILLSWVDKIDEMSKSPWYDAFVFLATWVSKHGKSLATSGLAISEHGAVVALNNSLH